MYIWSHLSQENESTGKVAHPARGQLNRKNDYSLSPFVPENLISRDGFGSPAPRQPAHLHTQTESGAYFRDSSQVRMTTKETENCCDFFLSFGDIRRSHLDCISGPTLSHLGYISRHTAVTMGLCGFTQPSVLCMLGHRSGPAHQFRKNQFGGCGTDIYTYRYIDI